MNSSFKITASREGAPLPTSAGAAIMEEEEEELISFSSAMKEKHEFIFILQEKDKDGEHASACKITLVADAVVVGGIGAMTIETAKSCIKVEPADDDDDGGGMVLKVECSYKLKLMPVPSVEAAQAVQESVEAVQEQEETPETHEMGGGEAAANFKVKQD